jgi:hypothetical protein
MQILEREEGCCRQAETMSSPSLRQARLTVSTVPAALAVSDLQLRRKAVIAETVQHPA